MLRTWILLSLHRAERSFSGLLHARTLGEQPLAFFQLAPLPQDLRQRIVGAGVRWIETYGSAQRLFGRRHFSFLFERRAQHEIGLGVVRPKRNGGAHLLHRAIEFSGLPARN